jgi:hypothetical protein
MTNLNSDSVNLGSNPSPPANKIKHLATLRISGLQQASVSRSKIRPIWSWLTDLSECPVIEAISVSLQPDSQA